MKNRKLFLILLCFVGMVGLAGCGASGPDKQSGKEYFYAFTDDSDRAIQLNRKPERIIVLSPSFLDILEAVGGNVVGKAKSNIAKTPKFAENAADVGFIFNINTEKVVGLKPDLVIAYKGMHEKFIPLLTANGIPVAVLNLKTFEDVKRSARILGAISGSAAKGEQVAADLDAQIARTVAKLPKVEKRIAILHSNAQSVTVELDNSIAGCVAKLLHLKNVIQGEATMQAPTGEVMPDKAPYSLEALLEKDPEVIFITSMGTKEEINARLENEVKSNPAWNSIAAVKNDRVIFLPDELFLLNPGMAYPKAVEYMAEKLYPDSTGGQKSGK